MKAIAVLAVIVLAATASVTVAPLFPLRGAVPDFALVALVLLAIAAGPRSAMLGLPALAIALSFLSGRSAGLLIVAYLPLLPLARWLEDASPLMPVYFRLALVTVATGLLARITMSLGAFATGADFLPGLLITDILLPGMVLDWAFFTLAYLPPRAVGWRPRPAALQQRRGLA